MWTVSVLAVALLVAGAIITTIVGLDYRDTKLAEDARGEALDAGKQTAGIMFGYQPDNVEQHVADTRESLSGPAQQQYDEIITEANLVAEVQKQQVKSEVSIQDAGVVSSTRDTALLLIFMNQSVTRDGKDLVSVNASRLQYSMEREGDRWLVTNIDILTDDSVKARLAEDADKPGASTIPVPVPSDPSGAPAEPVPAPAP